jgi:hypothetical protein
MQGEISFKRIDRRVVMLANLKSKLKSKKNQFVFFSLIAVAAVALALDRGRFFCSNCMMPMAPPEIRSFVGNFVNPVAFPQSTTGIPKDGWKLGDTFSVCNGTDCVQYITAGEPGVTFSPKLKYPDPRTGYSGEGTSLTFNGTGAGGDASSSGVIPGRFVEIGRWVSVDVACDAPTVCVKYVWEVERLWVPPQRVRT